MQRIGKRAILDPPGQRRDVLCSKLEHQDRVVGGMNQHATSIAAFCFGTGIVSSPFIGQEGGDVLNSFGDTHLIPRRDRLARPDHPMEGLLWTQLRTSGITLVFMDGVAPAIAKGKRADMGDIIKCLIDSDQAGRFRRDLAEKMIHSQIALARQGLWTGGRPPFGFRRWLIRPDGTLVRQLDPGKRVKMAGHHACFAPVQNKRFN